MGPGAPWIISNVCILLAGGCNRGRLRAGEAASDVALVLAPGRVASAQDLASQCEALEAAVVPADELTAAVPGTDPGCPLKTGIGNDRAAMLELLCTRHTAASRESLPAACKIGLPVHGILKFKSGMNDSSNHSCENTREIQFYTPKRSRRVEGFETV